MSINLLIKNGYVEVLLGVPETSGWDIPTENIVFSITVGSLAFFPALRSNLGMLKVVGKNQVHLERQQSIIFIRGQLT